MVMEEKDLEQALRAADIVEIQMLHGRYLSLLDRGGFKEILNKLMATEHPEVTYEMVESGPYIGKEHIANHFAGPPSGTAKTRADEKYGWCGLQYIWGPNITLNKDATRARAQWNQLSPHTMKVSPYPGNEHKMTAYWFIGKYDNEYIKIDGEWKLLKCHICARIRTPYDEGWVKQPDCRRIYHPERPGLPDGPARYYTYHPDAVYSKDGVFNWGPSLPEEDSDF